MMGYHALGYCCCCMQYISTYIKNANLSHTHSALCYCLLLLRTVQLHSLQSSLLSSPERLLPPSKSCVANRLQSKEKEEEKNRELLEAAAEVKPLENNHIISLAAAWSFEVYLLPGDSIGLLVPILKVNEKNGRIISKIGKPHHIHGLLCGLQGFPFKKVFWDY